DGAKTYTSRWMWRLVLSDSTVKRSPRNSVRWASKAARRTGSRATAIAEAAARGEALGVMRSSRGVDGSGGRLTGPDPVGAGRDPVGVLVAAAGPIPPCHHAGGVQGQPAGGLARRPDDVEPDQARARDVHRPMVM